MARDRTTCALRCVTGRGQVRVVRVSFRHSVRFVAFQREVGCIQAASGVAACACLGVELLLVAVRCHLR